VTNESELLWREDVASEAYIAGSPEKMNALSWSMPTIRHAVPEDAALITAHRREMYRDNNVRDESVLDAIDLEFGPWVTARLLDGRYVGLLLEEDGRVIAGTGIFFADFPPHWMDLLNVYTEPQARGNGYAKRLMEATLEECRKRGVPTVVLHASKFGRPIYEQLGFVQTDEMMLRLTL
jgi:GNAT superfamily N-acetyltransferase